MTKKTETTDESRPTWGEMVGALRGQYTQFSEALQHVEERLGGHFEALTQALLKEIDDSNNATRELVTALHGAAESKAASEHDAIHRRINVLYAIAGAFALILLTLLFWFVQREFTTPNTQVRPTPIVVTATTIPTMLPVMPPGPPAINGQ